MNLKCFLLSSVTALVAPTYARAATSLAEPEPAEYARVCDAYGAGFFYIPGSETCLKIGGYLRFDAHTGGDSYGFKDRDSYFVRSRADLTFDMRNETEFGTLRSFIELRYNYDNGENARAVQLNNAYVELGGFRVGASDSRFGSWTGYLGKFVDDDVIQDAHDVTNQVSYTFAVGDGFSAFIGAEQGGQGFEVEGYMPHIVGGVKFEDAWGRIAAVAGYDARSEEWAAKVRLDVNFSDSVSAWVMGGYKSDGDEYKNNYYGTWHGDFAVWGGVAAQLSEKATFNAQVAYEDDGTTAAALNLAYEIVPNLTITPEINYTSFGGDRGGFVADGQTDAFEFVIRFQRNF